MSKFCTVRRAASVLASFFGTDEPLGFARGRTVGRKGEGEGGGIGNDQLSGGK